MSQTIDDRIVQLTFDNKQFESGVSQSLKTLDKLDKSLDLKDGTKGLERVQKTANSIKFTGMLNGLEELKDGVDKINSRFTILGKTADKIKDSIANKLKNAITQPVKTFETQYKGLMNQIEQGGMRRAKNIAQAKFQINGLGMDWNALSKDIDYAVSGTAYGFDSAAKAASQLAASSVQAGDDMKRALRGISGLAAMTNSSYDDIAQVFTKTAGQGKVMAEELNQVASRGVNAAATMAKYFNGEYLTAEEKAAGKQEELNKQFVEMWNEYKTKSEESISEGTQATEAQIRSLASKSAISFDMFARSMDSAFGEHATAANKTFSGAMDNMKASLSRLGAEFTAPWMNNLINIFNRIREIFNNIKTILMPVINGFNQLEFVISVKVANALDKLAGLLGMNKGLLEGFGSYLGSIARIFGGEEMGILDQFKEAGFDTVADQIEQAQQALYLVGESKEKFRKGEVDQIMSIDDAIKQVIADAKKMDRAASGAADSVSSGMEGTADASEKAADEADTAVAQVTKTSQELHDAVQAIWSEQAGATKSWDTRESEMRAKGFTEAQIKAVHDTVNEMSKSGRTNSSQIDEVLAEMWSGGEVKKSTAATKEFVVTQEIAKKAFMLSREQGISYADALEKIKNGTEDAIVVTEDLNNPLGMLKDVIANVAAFAYTASIDLKNAFDETFNGADKTKAPITGLKKVFVAFFQTTKLVITVLKPLGKLAVSVGKLLWKAFGPVINWLITGYSWLVKWLNNSGALVGIINLVTAGINKLSSTIEWLWSIVKDSNIFRALSGSLSAFATMLEGITWKNITKGVSGLFDYFTGKKENLPKSVTKLTEKFKTFKKTVLGIKIKKKDGSIVTLSDTLKAINKNKYISAIYKDLDVLKNKLKNLNFRQWIGDTFTNFKFKLNTEGFVSAFQSLWTSIKQKTKANSIWDLFSNVTESLKQTSLYKTVIQSFNDLKTKVLGIKIKTNGDGSIFTLGDALIKIKNSKIIQSLITDFNALTLKIKSVGSAIKEWIVSAFNQFKLNVEQVGVVGAFKGLWKNIKNTVKSNFNWAQIWEGLKSSITGNELFKTIKTKFEETFKSLTGVDFSTITSKIGTLFDSITKNEKVQKAIKNIQNGLTKISEISFDSIINSVKAFYTQVLDEGPISALKSLAGKITEALSDVFIQQPQYDDRGFLLNTEDTSVLGTIKSDWDAITTAVTGAKTAVKEFFSSIGAVGPINAFNAAVSDLLGIFGGLFGETVYAADLDPSLKGKVGNSSNGNIVTETVDYTKSVGNEMASATTTVTSVAGEINKFTEAIEGLKEIFKPAVEALYNFLESFGLEGLLTAAGFVKALSAIGLLQKVGQTVDVTKTAIKTTTKKIKGIPRAVTTFLDSLSELNILKKITLKVEAFKHIAGSIFLMAAAIAIVVFAFIALCRGLEGVDQKQIDTAASIIFTIAVAVVGVTFAMATFIDAKATLRNVMNKDSGSKVSILEPLKYGFENIGTGIKSLGTAAKLIAIAVLIGVIVAALFALYGAIKLYSTLDFSDPSTNRAIATIGGIMFSLAAVVAIIGGFTKGAGLSMLAATPLIMAILIAITAMFGLIKVFAKIDDEKELVPGLLRIVVVVAALSAMLYMVTKSVSQSKPLEILAAMGMLVTLIGAVTVVLGLISIMAVMPWDVFRNGAIKVGIVLLALVIAVAVIEKFSKDGSALTAIATLGGITLAIIALTGSLLILSILPQNKLITAAAVIAGCLIAIMFVVKAAQKSGKKSWATLLALAATIAVLAGSLFVLSTINTAKLIASGAVMAGLLIVIYFIQKAAQKSSKNSWGTLLALAGVIAALGISLYLIGQVGIANVIVAGIIMAVLLKVITGMQKAAQKASKNSWVPLLSIAAVIAVIGGVLYGLAKLNALNVAIAGIIMAVLLKVVTGMQEAAQRASKNSWIPLLSIAAVITVLGGVLYGLAKLNVLNVAVAGIIMAVLLKVITGMQEASQKASKSSWIPLLSIAAVITVIGGVMYGLAQLPPVNVAVVGIAMAVLVKAITGLQEAAQKADPKTWIPLLALAGLITVIGSVLYGLAQLPMANLAVAGLVMAGLMAVIGLTIITGKEAKLAIPSALAIAVVIGALALAVGLLASYVDPTAALEVALGLAALIAAVGLCMKAIGGSGSSWLTGIKAGVSFASFIAIIVGLGYALGELDAITDGKLMGTMKKSVPVIKAIMEMIPFMASIKLKALSKIGWAGGFNAAGAIVAFIGIIGGIALALAGLDIWTDGGVTAALEKAVPMIETIGNLIGRLIGSMLGGIFNSFTGGGIDTEGLDKVFEFVNKMAGITIPKQSEFSWSEGDVHFVDQSMLTFGLGLGAVIAAVNSLEFTAEDAAMLEEKGEWLNKIADFTSQMAAITIPTQTEFSWTSDGFTYVDTSMESFGEGMQAVIEAINTIDWTGVDTGTLQTKIEFLDAIAGFTADLAALTIPVQTDFQWTSEGVTYTDTSLETFAGGMQGIITAINSINWDDFDTTTVETRAAFMEAIATFTERLAGITIPTQGEWEVSLEGIKDSDTSLQTFATGMQGVVTAINMIHYGSLTEETLEKKKKFLNMIVGFTRKLANVKIPAQQKIAEQGAKTTLIDMSITTFATGMQGIVDAINSIDWGDLDEETLEQKKQYMDNIVGFVEGLAGITIPEQTNFDLAIEACGFSITSGSDSSLKTFAEGMGEVAKVLNEMDPITNISVADVQDMADCVSAMADAASGIPEQKTGIAAWFSGDTSLSNFAKEMGNAVPFIKQANDSAQGINAARFENISGAVTAMIEAVNTMNKANTEGVETSGADLSMTLTQLSGMADQIRGIGEAFSAFSGLGDYDVSDVDKIPEILLKLAEISKAFEEDEGMEVSESSFFGLFGEDKNPFEKLKEIVNSLGGITIEVSQITAITDALNLLSSTALGEYTAGFEDTDGTIETAIKDMIQNAVDAIDAHAGTNVSDKFKDAGTAMLTALADGMGDSSGVEVSTDNADGAASLIQSILDSIVNGEGNEETFKKAGADLMAKIAQGIADGASSAESSATSTAGGGEESSLVSSILSSMTSQTEEFNKAGSDFIDALATGMTEGDVSDSAAKAVSAIATAMNGQTSQFKDAGNGFMSSLAATIRSATGAKNAAVSTAKSVAKAFNNDTAKNDVKKVGQALTDGLREGMVSHQGTLWAKARSIAQETVRQMKSAAEVASPSKATMRLGAFLDEGLAVGMKNNSKSVYKASAGVANAAVDAMNETLEIHSPSRITIKAGKRFSKGFAVGMDAGGKWIVQSSKKAANEAISGLSYMERQGYIANLTKQLDKNNKKLDKIGNKGSKKRKNKLEKENKWIENQIAELNKKAEAEQKLIENVDKSISRQKTADTYYNRAGQTATDQLNQYLTILNSITEGSDEWYSILEKINNLSSQIAQENYNINKDLLERQSWGTDKTLKQQSKDWLNLRNSVTKYSEEWNLYNEEYKNAEKERYKTSAELAKNAADQIDELYSNLLDNIANAWESYENDRKSRAKELAQFTGVFDIFETPKTLETPETLRSNLKTQVKGLENYQNALTDLMEKVNGSTMGAAQKKAFIDEITAMGPEGVANIKNVLAMTTTELNDYFSDYAQKFTIGESISKVEFNQYDWMKEDVKEEIRGYYKDFEEAALDVVKDTNQTLESLGANTWVGAVQVGENIVYGSIEGVKNPELRSQLDATISDLGNNVVKNFQNTLDINSPSKVFEWMGEMCVEGLMQGISSTIDAFKGQTSSLTDDINYTLQDSLRAAIERANSDDDLNPVITPVIDDSLMTAAMADFIATNRMIQLEANANAAGLERKSTKSIQNDQLANYLNGLTNMVKDSGGSVLIHNENKFEIVNDNPTEVAEEVSRILQKQYEAREAVWA